MVAETNPFVTSNSYGFFKYIQINLIEFINRK